MQSADKHKQEGMHPIEAGQVEIISRRALIIGVAISIVLAACMILWRLAGRVDTGKKLAEFEFTAEEPEKEEIEIELKQPMRDIAVQQGERFEMVVEVNDQPTVDMVVVPSVANVVEEVAQVRDIAVQHPEITVAVRDVEVDAPEPMSEVAETIEFGVNAATVDSSGPTNVFTYVRPAPYDMWRLFTWARASMPTRTLTSMRKMVGEPEALSLAELEPISVNLSGDADSSKAIARSGGSNARSAVDSAFQWLAAHQETDGRWAPEKNGGKGSAVGNTGLSLLAFMAGGHTPRRGEYRREVMKGLEWMLKQQKPDGKVGDTMYEHAIAATAFCEAFGRAQDERMGAAAKRSVAWIERNRLADGAWRYHPTSQFSDVSVTSWVIQALKAAKLAQVKFDARVHAQALMFVDTATDKGAGPNSSGAVGYIYEASQNYPHSAYPAMTCAAMLIRQFSGIGTRSDILLKGAALTRSLPPDWRQKNFYFWYYATYAMHNMGGENRIWWNKRIRDVLVENQSRGGDNAGSWDPQFDKVAEEEGRIYTTALGALCLQASYRYSDALNGFGVVPGMDDFFSK